MRFVFEKSTNPTRGFVNKEAAPPGEGLLFLR